ncbi:hypothetical protein V8U11_10980 [Pseudomonas chlororaphis]|uniref:hypothetical protein n=1 Tax=Pseudomonas chlororaphis TaxID=587753 RepID=UPI0030D24DED
MITYPKIPLSWVIFQQLLSDAVGHPVILAGGCLRDLYSGRQESVKDLDFWPEYLGSAHRKEVLAKLQELRFTGRTGCTLAYTEGNLKDRGIMAIDWLVAPNGQEVNLIWIDGADPQAILNGFDFGINQACWDGSQWTISDAFFQDHQDKTISLIRSWEVPKRLCDRIRRMQDKFPEYTLLFEVPQE